MYIHRDLENQKFIVKEQIGFEIKNPFVE